MIDEREEPIERLRSYLAHEGAWTKEQEEALLKNCRAEVEAAAADYLAMAPEAPRVIFDHLYEVLPTDLAPQLAELLAQDGGGDA